MRARVARPSIYPLYAINRDHILLFQGHKEGPSDLGSIVP